MKRKVLLLLAVVLMGFSSNAQVSMIGPGATGDWGIDVDMQTTDNNIWTLVGYVMPGGEFKFRLNHDWTTNWGDVAFPMGTGTQNGPNIPAVAGTYDITFNQTTGEYSFTGGAPIPVVKIVGSAVNGPPEGLTLTTLNGETYTLSATTFLDGYAQFDIDGSIFGGDTFPNGFISDPSLFIPVTAGDYTSVTVNIGTGEYTFTAAPVFQAISIVGSGAGGWPGSPENPGPTDINQLTTTDGIIYTLDGLVLTNGEAKFRQNNDWTVNWGGATFPAGVGVQDGANIPTVAGTYSVTFNRTTGEYTFSFPSISLVGSGAGGWPGSPENPGPIDNNQLTTTDGVNYTLSGVVLTDGEAKFRQNNDWAVNWGAAVFPAGTGIQDGANIPTVAGTYDLLFNRTTGDFSFAPLATKGFSTSNFKVYPNPTQNNWNFTSVKEAIQSVQIVDVLGKTILTVSPKNTTATIDASSLNAGVYFARIATASATNTIKLVKN